MAAISTSSATTAAITHGDRRGAGGRGARVKGSGPGSDASWPCVPAVPNPDVAGRGGAGRHPGAGAPAGGVQRAAAGGAARGGSGGRRTVRVTSSDADTRGPTIVVSASDGGG